MSTTLALAVGGESWPIGTAETLHAFFSTISHHLEPGGWGTRFPAIMHRLYQGELPVALVETALSELTLARRELAGYPPAYVVWDIDDLSARPPWGDRIDDAVPNLARYFVTAEGRDLFEVLAMALIRLRVLPGGAARIVGAQALTPADA